MCAGCPVCVGPVCVGFGVCRIRCVPGSVCARSGVCRVRCVPSPLCARSGVCWVRCVPDQVCAWFGVCRIRRVPGPMCAGSGVCRVRCVGPRACGHPPCGGSLIRRRGVYTPGYLLPTVHRMSCWSVCVSVPAYLMPQQMSSAHVLFYAEDLCSVF